MYLDIQATFSLENTTLYECLALPRHGVLNSPFVCQFEMLLSLNVLLEFPSSISEMAGTIILVRVLNNE